MTIMVVWITWITIQCKSSFHWYVLHGVLFCVLNHTLRCGIFPESQESRFCCVSNNPNLKRDREPNMYCATNWSGDGRVWPCQWSGLRRWLLKKHSDAHHVLPGWIEVGDSPASVDCGGVGGMRETHIGSIDVRWTAAEEIEPKRAARKKFSIGRF